jgi:hypothetical protein
MVKTSAFICLIMLSMQMFAQDEIPLVDDFGEEVEIIEHVFPAIQIFNLHTTNLLSVGDMKLYIGHRMGEISSGSEGLYGLYTANSRIGADIGITKKFTFGMGTTSQQKIFDAYGKYSIVHQGSFNVPVSIALLSNIAFKSAKQSYPEDQVEAWQKLSYYSSIMVSRKVSNKLSIQGLAAVVHRNMVPKAVDKNTIFATGVSVNYKLNRIWHLAGEYVFVPKEQISSTSVTPHIVSLGVQIQSGPRHVFQIFFSNSGGLNEFNTLTATHKAFSLNSIRFCFNIPTTFKLF